MNAMTRFAKAAQQNNTPVNVEAVLEEALKLLDAHDDEQHVDTIEHLFTPKVVKGLKDAEILDSKKFFSQRQAAGAIWLLWQSM